MLRPTSTIGEYVAAGVTALIPGSGFISSIARSTTSEVIVATEKAIKGEKVSFNDSMVSIITGTVTDYASDYVSGKISGKITNKIEKLMPKNYSSYAGNQYKKCAYIAKDQIYKKMRRAITLNNLACDAVETVFGFVSSALMDR